MPYNVTEINSKSPQITDLNIIDVPRPCTMDWALMSGDERVRFCSHCTKNVYNISEMTTESALQLINESEGRLCISMRRRSDGTIVTSDCPPIKEHSESTRKRSLLQFSLASLLALLTASAGLCASAPWIGEKIQPLVDHYFPPAAALNTVEGEMMCMGDMEFPPQIPQPSATNKKSGSY